MTRSRSALAALCLALVGAGLASRSGAADALPGWFTRNAGDALWTTNLYFLLALLRPASAPGRLLLAALLLSFAVEFSQLYQADWIDALRANRFGALVLGRGFLWADLPRYAAGAALAWMLDRALWQRR